jgi:hypothetical protein
MRMRMRMPMPERGIKQGWRRAIRAVGRAARMEGGAVRCNEMGLGMHGMTCSAVARGLGALRYVTMPWLRRAGRRDVAE